ncbi:hypothetical protein Mgra_00009870 [Meloidogyne graminicola]|uniref:Uncharacterized protein n=1 Tax=Meloidogyne graminicola TaxID=189291 RepID=A0A8S9ZBP5_9BILA|nr:hypothetical protein Mgra_00009870 [Meloidogyne graminicola]
MMIALSFFYAMLTTIFALVFELSHIISGDTKNRRNMGIKELIFGLYMYGISIIFLIYCYIALLLNPKWKKRIGALIIHFRSESNQNIIKQIPERKVSHSSPSAGSLFLRLGCVVFGVIGTVYYAFNVFLCISDTYCQQNYLIWLDLLSIIFVFTQMHFVFCNWKLSISQYQTICRFGTMHLVATNLWIWIRYILIEESLMGDEIRQVFARNIEINNWMNEELNKNNIYNNNITNNNNNKIIKQNISSNILLDEEDNSEESSYVARRSLIRRCEGAECVLASFNEVMYTSIVEYSLIGAAVMFIVWRNIGKIENPIDKFGYVPRKHRIRLDCSKSTTGLFFGLAFLAGTFTSMAVFSGYTIMGQNQLAATVFGFTDIVHYLISTCGCIVALWRMRLLRFYNLNNKEEQFQNINVPIYSLSSNNSSELSTQSSSIRQTNNQELLDMILLAFGMTGEMIYSVAGLLGLTGDPNWQPLTIILLAGKLRVGNDPILRERQPGKQAITFLLLANISMFLMNLLEAEKAGVSETVVNFYGKRSWVFLVRSFSPLTIFYRFHSSVCLAEVWKTTYSWKE